MRMLLDYGADPLLSYSLHVAAAFGNIEAVKVIYIYR